MRIRYDVIRGKKLKELVSEGIYEEALTLYKQEFHTYLGREHGNDVIIHILPSVIKACSSHHHHHHHHHQLGLGLHCLCLKSGFDHYPLISNSLVSLYAKLFSTTHSARKMFDTMPQRDSVAYSCMVNTYTHEGTLLEALRLLKQMYSCGFVPKPQLVAGVVSLCARSSNITAATMLHALLIIDQRIHKSIFTSTALLSMYLKTHDLSTALAIFNRMEVKNEVSWTTLISGCITCCQYHMAIDFFLAMQREGVRPNRVTLVSLLPACTELGSLTGGKQIYAFAFRHGFYSDHHLAAALVTMYCKCGDDIRSARLVFQLSDVKDVVMWSSMIQCCAQSGDCAEAMELFSQMRKEGFPPNSVTLLALVSVCTYLASLRNACGIHCHVLKSGFNSDISLGNALIHMYSKCGSLRASHKVFNALVMKDVVSWSSLISGFGLHGKGKEALILFQEMQESITEMDAMALLAILSACNHAGMVEEGRSIFKQAFKYHKLPIGMEHYACYIDLLAKSGKVDDAFDVARKMPMKPSATIWSSLLSACKLHNRLDVSTTLAYQLIKSEPDNPANYALLSMIHAESGNWHIVEYVRKAMQDRGLNKCYGFSRIELQN